MLIPEVATKRNLAPLDPLRLVMDAMSDGSARKGKQGGLFGVKGRLANRQ